MSMPCGEGLVGWGMCGVGYVGGWWMGCWGVGGVWVGEGILWDTLEPFARQHFGNNFSYQRVIAPG